MEITKDFQHEAHKDSIKAEKIINIIMMIPVEKWVLTKYCGAPYRYETELNGNTIIFELSYEDTRHCINIDGIRFYNKKKMVALMNKLKEYNEKKATDDIKTKMTMFLDECGN